MNSMIQAALLPVIAQQIRTHTGFQKIPEKEIATCAELSTEEEVKAGEDTSEQRLKFWEGKKKKKQKARRCFYSIFMWPEEAVAFTEGLE